MFAAESWGNERLARKELLALHTKLGHAAFPHLVEQLALAYPDRDASLLRSVTRGLVCESCEKRKKAPRRPLVAMPKEPHFNYETGSDLWYLRGQPVLHVICLFTRPRHCSVLRDKSATHVCHLLLHLWVKYYGPPVLLYCNGSSDSTQIIHQCDQNFNDSQMYISAVNFPLVFMFSVRRQMSPVSARRVAFVFRDFPIGFI